METIVGIFLFIFIGMILAGFLGNAGNNPLENLTWNVATALAMLVLFSIIITTASWDKAFGMLAQGIPFIGEVLDFGSMTVFWKSEPLEAFICFIDTVLLMVITDIIDKFLNDSKGKGFMAVIFVKVVVGLLGLFVLNGIVKKMEYYDLFISILGSIYVAITTISIPVSIYGMISGTAKKVGSLIIVSFLCGTFMGFMRSALLKACVYVGAIWILDKYTNGFSVDLLDTVMGYVAMLAPLAVMLISCLVIINSVFKK